MPCRTFQGDGFSAIVCTRGKRPMKCYVCARPCDILCDHPAGVGKTCDRPCCKTHSEHVGKDRDYCLTHAEFERKKKAEQDRVASEMEQAGLYPCWRCEAPVERRHERCSDCIAEARAEAGEQDHPEERCPPRE